MKAKALAFGEVLWDVYPDEKYIGGAPFNFAAHFAQLGGDAFLLSAVGQDAFAEETKQAVRAHGVHTKYISTSDKPTGQCLVTLDEKGVPSYRLLTDVAYDDIAIPHVDEKMDVLYFGTLALRGEHNVAQLKHILAVGGFSNVFVDVNIRKPYYSAPVLRFALSSATFAKISDEELPLLLQTLGMTVCTGKEGVQAIAEVFANLQYIILTCGGEGSLFYDVAKEKWYAQGAEAVSVVSTVGAGDSFSAAFLVHFLQNHDAPRALAFASRVAGFVVSQKGAVPFYCTEQFV